MRAALIGNYGVGNLGDEALKEYFLTRFPDIDWTVLSAQPGEREVPRLPFGWRSFTRTPWWRTVAALWRCEAVVFGGGSLFTDIESPKACMLWWWHARIARFLRKPVHLAFQGIGPFKTGVGEQFAMKTALLASSISVRDSLSKARAEHWNLNTEIVLSFDPVISLLEAKKNGVRTKKLVIIPRRNSDENLLSTICNLSREEKWDEIHVALLQPDDPSEAAIAHKIVNVIKNGQKVTVIPVRTLRQLGDTVSGAGMVVSQRFHGALAAIALGCPLRIAIQEAGDKLEILRGAQGKQTEELMNEVRAGERALREALCR